MPMQWVSEMTAARMETEMNLTLLETLSLSAGYGGEPIIEDISVDTCEGEIVCVTGPNGSGKSTLLKAIVGHARLISGSVVIGGEKCARPSPEAIARMGVGYVPQHRDVFGALSVLENLEMGGYMLPKSAVGERIEEVMELIPRLRALSSRTASKLSGGERKMAAVGRVMMTRPRVLLLDEPTAGLSPAATVAFVNEQLRTVATSCAVLIVEQKAKAVRDVADRAYVLVAGKVRVHGPASEVLSDESLAQAYFT